MANKNAVLRCLWALINDSKYNRVSLLTILTGSLCLQVAQMPISQDLATLALTDRTDSFTPCYACLQGNYILIIYYYTCKPITATSLF